MDIRPTSKERELSVFREMYPPEIIESIAARATPANGLKLLYQLLIGANEDFAVDKRRFAKCLRFAKERNGLDEDRRERLRNPDNYASWKAVQNELLVPYVFAETFRLPVLFIVDPTKKGEGDFQIVQPDGNIVVEVKTPRGDDPTLQGPRETAHYGWDEELIKPAFLQAAKQLQRGRRNLVVICTQLCAWIHDWEPFRRLLYGEDVIAARFDVNRGELGEPRMEFRANGELNKHRPKRYTRVSAVASFRTDQYSTGPFDPKVMQIQLAVLHNYFALSPVSPQVFPSAEQFVPDRERRSIRHIGEKHSTIVFYMGDSPARNVGIRARVAVHQLFRKMRRAYLKFKMRRVLKSMMNETGQEFDD